MDLKHTKSSEERWFEKETCGEIPFCKMLKNAKTVEWRSNLEAWHWGWEWGGKLWGIGVDGISLCYSPIGTLMGVS